MYKNQIKTDIVIPLSDGSLYDNMELRMALRSIDQYAENHNAVYIISTDPPAWLRNVNILSVPDSHRRNKDANIIEKIAAAPALTELSEQLIFWSDDQLALRSFDTGHLPLVYNRRGPGDFRTDKIWHRRMLNTFDFLQRCNHHLNWNWDSHVPQRMNKYNFCNLVNAVDCTIPPGYCINTLYFGWLDTRPYIEQNMLKTTIEQPLKLAGLPDSLFLGYNDRALQGNLPALLKQKFNCKCRYEK